MIQVSKIHFLQERLQDLEEQLHSLMVNAEHGTPNFQEMIRLQLDYAQSSSGTSVRTGSPGTPLIQNLEPFSWWWEEDELPKSMKDYLWVLSWEINLTELKRAV